MTGFDGMSTPHPSYPPSPIHSLWCWLRTDYLQYTITSRTEMPNQRFCEEIERAAEDLYNLHASAVEEARKSHL